MNSGRSACDESTAAITPTVGSHANAHYAATATSNALSHITLVTLARLQMWLPQAVASTDFRLSVISVLSLLA
jgi:hypothetical protein